MGRVEADHGTPSREGRAGWGCPRRKEESHGTQG